MPALMALRYFAPFFGVCFDALASAFCLSVHAFNSARLFFLSAALSPFGAVLNWAQGSAGFWVDWDKPCKDETAINNPVSTEHDKRFIEFSFLL